MIKQQKQYLNRILKNDLYYKKDNSDSNVHLHDKN